MSVDNAGSARSAAPVSRLGRSAAYTSCGSRSGGVAAADLVMLDVAMELYDGPDAQRGFANTADAFNKDIEPPTLVFEGK